MKKHVPNFITSLNLVSGFIAVILAAEGRIVSASWFIVAAMIFDFLDGFSARILKAYSDIGKELDSLADIVSFGIAPAVIIFRLLTDAFSSMPMKQIYLSEHRDLFLIIIASIMPVCAALRLAIFNTDSSQSKNFKGLPTPASAIAVISVVIASHYSESGLFDFFVASPAMLILFTIALSLLMVSRLDLFSLKVNDLKLKGNEGRYLMILLIAISFLIMGINAAALIIPIYIISSIAARLI
ncbi:MAG TPA: CDP-diacylglycerol--serine O-phosphatidyltransferase [Bacteroidales bacterium]|nr:CDP-diacylglycerol--serine O-phosphatidyltransferase [Bacteroidales bacterium]